MIRDLVAGILYRAILELWHKAIPRAEAFASALNTLLAVLMEPA